MNLSGRSVQPLVHWHKLDLADLMVIYDDMDLPTGSLRIRASGGSGGHKGMKSIIERLNSEEFPGPVSVLAVLLNTIQPTGYWVDSPAPKKESCNQLSIRQPTL